jgi:spore photoproduct lyase
MIKIKNTKKFDYTAKFISFHGKTLFEQLDSELQDFIHHISHRFRFTFQEFRQVVEAARDLDMWREQSLPNWWQEYSTRTEIPDIPKEKFLADLRDYLKTLQQQEKSYKNFTAAQFRRRNAKKIITTDATENIYGMCPVASPKTVCCNLRTIDAVENCTFGCSYCTIQTFYTPEIRINCDIEKKLEAIKLDANRFYHFGTGQSSDSLAYGDREGILTAHCKFATAHPNILMEFKTKSKNISFFLENEIPVNVVCSWSLNPQVIITNEEHFTATLEERLASARAVADKGVKVAFHFHPMVYYSGWESDYPAIAQKIMDLFSENEVLFISFGSVTLIKPVIQKIRDLGNPSKILQMDFVTDPHGKFTYHDDIKITMFSKMYAAFNSWQDKVFFYLCMEKAAIWQQSLGYVHESNEIFEQTFGEKTMSKIAGNRKPTAER